MTPAAFGLGEGVIANRSYRRIKVVHAGNGYPMDLHEFELTRTETPSSRSTRRSGCTCPGTPEGTLSPLLDAIVQEVDINTGLVVWEWHSYGHIPLETSQATPQNSASYDAFHINAIQALKKDRVLISARDTSAIYEIDRATGRHPLDARRQGRATSGSAPAPSSTSSTTRSMLPQRPDQHVRRRGRPAAAQPLLARSDPAARTSAATRRRWCASSPARATTSAQSEGSMQRLPGGNVFVGFGSQPFFSEFSSRGKLLLDGSLPQDDGTYRDLPLPLERHAQDPAGGRRAAAGHRRLGLRELERRHGGRQVAGAGRPERRRSLARVATARPQRLRDPHRRDQLGHGLRGARPRLEGARDRPLGGRTGVLSRMGKAEEPEPAGAYWPRPWTLRGRRAAPLGRPRRPARARHPARRAARGRRRPRRLRHRRARAPRAGRALRAAPRRSRSAGRRRRRSRPGSSGSTPTTLAVTASTPRLPGGRLLAGRHRRPRQRRPAHGLRPLGAPAQPGARGARVAPAPGRPAAQLVRRARRRRARDQGLRRAGGPRALDGLGSRPETLLPVAPPLRAARAVDRAARRATARP